MSIDGKRIYSTLESIAFTRSAGSIEERKAADRIMDEIKKMGFVPHLESFEIDDAKTEAELKVLEPYEKAYRIYGFKHAKSTPETGTTTEFIYVDDANENNYADLKGKLCMFGNLTCELDRLNEIGIAGILHSEGTAADRLEDLDLYPTTYRDKANRNKISSFTIAGPDAFELVNNGAQKVWFRLANTSYKTISNNIVVTIPGTEYPEQVIAVGAHYDSVPVGQGACDNGAGSAIILEILRTFVGNPSKRTLKFIWFGAEEIGLEGSKAYLSTHAEELKNYRLMVNVDVAGSVMGHNFIRATAEESVAHYLSFLAKEVGYPADVKQGLMGSDSTPFADRKIPAVGFGRGTASTLQFCHTRHDIMKYISASALEETAKFVSLFIHRMCESLIFPVPQTIPDDIIKRIDDMLGNNKA